MATEADWIQLREDLGLTEANFDNTAAEAVFVRAGVEYPNDTATAHAHARVIQIRKMLMEASKRHDYKRNQSTESLSQIAKQLKDRLEEWIAERDRLDAVASRSAGGTMRSGRQVRKPAARRIREYPGGI